MKKTFPVSATPVVPSATGSQAWEELPEQGSSSDCAASESIVPKTKTDDGILQALADLHSKHERRIEQILLRQFQRLEDALVKKGLPNQDVSQPVSDFIANEPEEAEIHEENKERTTIPTPFKSIPRESLRPSVLSSKIDLRSSTEGNAPALARSIIAGETVNVQATGVGKGLELVKDHPITIARRKTCAIEAAQAKLRYSNHSSVRLSTESYAKKTDMRHVIKSVIRSRQFEVCVASLICFNGLLVGIQAEWVVQHEGKENPRAFDYLDLFCTALFVVELALRFLDEGRHFLRPDSRSFRWNFFDTTVVGITLIENIFIFINVSSHSKVGLSSVRLFRMLRLVRIVRVIRVMRFFRELRVMVFGILNSAKTMFWAILLLAFMMYIFAVCVIEFVGDEQANRASSDYKSPLNDAEYALLMHHFGTMASTIFTLYKSITGGIDWGIACELLLNLGLPLGMLFALYIAFSIFCVLNILTGVFVENANKIISEDENTIMMEDLESRKDWLERVQILFDELDKNHTGRLEWPDFLTRIADVRLQAIFHKVGVEVETQTALGLFSMLDFDGTGSIDLDDFVVALQQIQGKARSIDIHRIRHEQKKVKQLVTDLYTLCLEHFTRHKTWTTGSSFEKNKTLVDSPMVSIVTSPPAPPEHDRVSHLY